MKTRVGALGVLWIGGCVGGPETETDRASVQECHEVCEGDTCWNECVDVPDPGCPQVCDDDGTCYDECGDTGEQDAAATSYPVSCYWRTTSVSSVCWVTNEWCFREVPVRRHGVTRLEQIPWSHKETCSGNCESPVRYVCAL